MPSSFSKRAVAVSRSFGKRAVVVVLRSLLLFCFSAACTKYALISDWKVIGVKSKHFTLTVYLFYIAICAFAQYRVCYFIYFSNNVKYQSTYLVHYCLLVNTPIISAISPLRCSQDRLGTRN